MSVPTAVYVTNITPFFEQASLLERARAIATPTRQEKAAHYRRREDVARSLVAELLLRVAFARAEIPFSDGYLTHNFGKPFLPNTEVEFNLSHAGEWVMCAVTESGAGQGIGCDVEKIDPAHATRILSFEARGGKFRLFTASERAFLDAAADEAERIDRFFRLWTLKESYAKSTACEVSFCPPEFSVVPGERHAIAGNPVALCREYRDLPGYACAASLRLGGELPPLQVVSMEECSTILYNEVKR